MTIDKAIKMLKTHGLVDEKDTIQDYMNAVKLGIEALKFRQRWEAQEGEDDFPRLPGETEE